MVQQRDVDDLLRQLEQMRAALLRDREAVRPQLDRLLELAGEMRERAAGGVFEAAVTSVHDLLQSFDRSLSAQAHLQSLQN